ncbi:MAG: glycosyltransferase [Elusimicrobiales bacterium]|nr:glycosyltransferase [Elusimicrobiales bacterium]MCK5582831.1 glycosyltransferase [Elusimicrobiales bacterium]
MRQNKKLKKAIETYNARNFSVYMDNSAFNNLIKLRNKFFDKKILLINLRDAPSNAHLERAFLRAASVSKEKTALDIFHSFENNYDGISHDNPTGFRVKYSGMDNLKEFTAKTKYDALIFIDLPYGDEELVPYAWFARRNKTPKKFFIANDVLLSRGSIFGMDLAEDLRLLKGFSAAYILDHAGLNGWKRFGLSHKIFKRRFAVDCRYFDNKKSFQGNYVFSCGSIARDFEALFEAMALLPKTLKLKIYTDKKLPLPSSLKNRVQFIAPSSDSSKMKNLIAGAKFVVLPTVEDKGNPGAGLSSSLMAMAMGKIALVRGNTLMHSYLKNGVNAFTYKKGCAAQLSRGIKRILALGEAEKKRIETNAREIVFKRNNMDIFAGEFIKKHCGD